MSKSINQIQKFLYLAAFFVPMGANYFSIDLGIVKLSLFRICILFAFIISLISNRWVVKIPSRNTTSGFFVTTILILACYSVVSVIWAKDYALWLRSTLFLIVGSISVYLCFFYFTSIENVIQCMKYFVCGIAIQACIGIYEILTHDYRFLTGTKIELGNYYKTNSMSIPIAMQANPNNMAFLMYLGVISALVLAINSSSRKVKKIDLLVALIFGVVLFATTSRAVVLALLLAIFFWMLFEKKSKVLLVIIAMTVIVLATPLIDYVSSFLHFSLQNSSDSERLGLIKLGLFLVAKSFGFGVGSGQAESYVLELGDIYGVGDITNLHNFWIEIIADFGIVIFVLFVIAYLKSIMTFLKNTKMQKNSKSSATSLVFFSGLIGYFIACISPSSVISLEWNWFFIGIFISLVKILESVKESDHL